MIMFAIFGMVMSCAAALVVFGLAFAVMCQLISNGFERLKAQAEYGPYNGWMLWDNGSKKRVKRLIGISFGGRLFIGIQIFEDAGKHHLDEAPNDPHPYQSC